MKGPSLLAYNSAKFTDVDFKSIQQIGDSLKKDAKGTKTGRFGVGVNSTYHLTDIPMFHADLLGVVFPLPKLKSNFIDNQSSLKH